MRAKYHNISIKESLIKKIDKKLEKKDFSSRAEFISYLIRIYFDEKLIKE